MKTCVVQIIAISLILIKVSFVWELEKVSTNEKPALQRQFICRLQALHRLSSSLSGPVVFSFWALSGRLQFTVRRDKFNKDSLPHLGGNPGANLKSISHRCYPILIAFVCELTTETIEMPLDFIRTSIHDEYDLMLFWHIFLFILWV